MREKLLKIREALQHAIIVAPTNRAVDKYAISIALLDSITEALDSQEMDDIIEMPTHNFGAATTMEAVYGKDTASRLRELALEVMDEDKQRKRINKIIESACPDDDVSKANWEEVVEYIRHLEARAAINTIQGKTDE